LDLARKRTKKMRGRACGFSLLEMLVSIVVLLVVAGVAMTVLVNMTKTQGTVANRTEMHSSVRSATELLQQEIGQAGRVSLPNPTVPVKLVGAVTTIVSLPQPVQVSSAAGMFVGEQLVIDAANNTTTNIPQETVTITSVDLTTNQIQAIFKKTHASGVPVRALGGFSSGIVPKGPADGSKDTVLRLYGDINDDGNMVYVEYRCNLDPNGILPGTLTRSVTPIIPGTVTVKPAEVLLDNVMPNPPNGGTAVPCFSYQQKPDGCNTLTKCYVVNVAVTLTVQTEAKDPQTNQYQKETKALLNIAPRNVNEAWQAYGLSLTDRVQPMPATVQTLIDSD
jgi:prepilin-type N-terminal cleavage/methylation domain-containing protein